MNILTVPLIHNTVMMDMMWGDGDMLNVRNQLEPLLF